MSRVILDRTDSAYQAALAQCETPLARLECLIAWQRPADTPWTPVTDYSFEARKQIEGQHPQLIKDAFEPKNVLDVGCGPGHLVRLLRDLDVNATGWDKHAKTSLLALPIRHSVKREDITLLARDDEDWSFYDLVICREVLEHLTVLEIRRAVANLCALSKKYVYVTTRFAKDPQSLLDVDTSDDLDPTHISMLNQDLLRVLFVLEGFKRRADLEMKLDWQQKGRCLVYERAV